MAESPEIQGATNLDQDNIEEVEQERDYWHERFEAAIARAHTMRGNGTPRRLPASPWTQERRAMGDISKWCQMCGAAPGEPCKVISGGEGLKPGDVRPDVHWHRSAEKKPAVLVPDEPGPEEQTAVLYRSALNWMYGFAEKAPIPASTRGAIHARLAQVGITREDPETHRAAKRLAAPSQETEV